jgi:hypothetical protein
MVNVELASVSAASLRSKTPRRQERPGADYATAESPSLLRWPGITGLLRFKRLGLGYDRTQRTPGPAAHPRQRRGW